MRYFFACLLLILTGFTSEAHAGLTTSQDTCDEICLAKMASLLAADMQAMAPYAADVARFDGPGSRAACSAPPRNKPAVHAIILAPFYENFIKLPGTQEDAKLLTALFTDKGVPGAFIRTFAGKANRQDILNGLEASLACVREKDQVVVTFSGGATTYLIWGAPNFPDFAFRHCAVAKPESFCAGLMSDARIEKEDGRATRTGDAYRRQVAQYDDLILLSSDAIVKAGDAGLSPTVSLDSRFIGLSAVELSNFITQLRNRGADAIVLLDTNYAARARLLDRQNGAAYETSWRWSRELGDKPIQPNVIDLYGTGKMAALYATRSDEIAVEGNKNGTILGELTFAVAEAIRSRASPNIKQLAEDVDRTMRQRQVRQVPVFEASEPDLRLLTPRSDNLLNPDQIEILKPQLHRGASVIDADTRQFKLVARYDGKVRAGYAAIDGNNVRPDANGQFEKDVETQGRNEFYLRVYGEDHTLLAERRLKFSESEVETAVSQQGTNYVLTIANQKYSDPNFPALATPIADADAFRDLVIRNFGYTDRLRINGHERSLSLRDATQNDIKQALFDIRKNITPDDRLLIYYAGHGEKDEETSYWVPVDGVAGSDFTWVNAFTIQDEIRKMNAGSILLVSDSCYAGGLTRSAIEPPPAGGRDKYLAKAGQLKSRQFIGSGGLEPVLDGGGKGHSIFAEALMAGMADMGKQPFTASELFETKVKPKVLSAGSVAEDGQVPVFYRIQRAGDEPASEFLFLPSK